MSSSMSGSCTSFPFWIPFISFYSLLSVAGTYKSVLNKSGKIETLILFLIIEKMLLTFHL